jgi:hypothetical protein
MPHDARPICELRMFSSTRKHTRRLGKPGRVAVFAMVETELARDIRRIRDENRSYPTKRVMPEYKKRALVVSDASGPDLRAVFDKMAFGPWLLMRFLVRQSLSSRKPTCKKTLVLVLSEMIRQARGYFRGFDREKVFSGR